MQSLESNAHLALKVKHHVHFLIISFFLSRFAHSREQQEPFEHAKCGAIDRKAAQQISTVAKASHCFAPTRPWQSDAVASGFPLVCFRNVGPGLGFMCRQSKAKQSKATDPRKFQPESNRLLLFFGNTTKKPLLGPTDR